MLFLLFIDIFLNNNKKNDKQKIGNICIIRFKILQLSIIYDLQVSLSSDIFILCSMIIHRIGMVTLNFGTVQWNPIDIEMHLCVSVKIKTCNFILQQPSAIFFFFYDKN